MALCLLDIDRLSMKEAIVSEMVVYIFENTFSQFAQRNQNHF